MPLLLFLAFIAVPIIEIAVIIQVGGILGVWPTIGLIILTAAAGTALCRAQGFAVLQRIQTNLNQGVFPAGALFDGAALLVAGVLLLTPGFVTDAFGLLLLIPPARRVIGRGLFGWLARRAEIRVGGGFGGGDPFGGGKPRGSPGARRTRDEDDVIEGEYQEIPQDRIDRDRDGRER